MDSIVEENGNSSNMDEGHNLSTSQHQQQQQQSQQQSNNIGNSSSNSGGGGGGGGGGPPPSVAPSGASVLTTATNVVQYLPGATAHGLQVQSVIQAANQSSVIQTATTNQQSSAMGMPKGSGVLYVGKPNATVIHTTSGNAVQIKPEPHSQHLDTNSEDSLSDEESPRRRAELTRRPSYNKIFTEISGPDIAAGVALQMSDSGGMATLPNTGGSTGGTLIHLPQDSGSPYYLANRIPSYTNNSGIPEDQTRKREIRLQKNREAARECRRKKKEYIKCLENRVAVLENQNKALIEELKSLKELYCRTKDD